MRKLNASQRGSALLIVLGFLALFLFMSGVMYSLTAGKSRSAVYHLYRLKTLGMAEAGMALALQKTLLDPNWTSGYTNKPFQDGFFTVTVNAVGPDTAILISEGYMSPKKSLMKHSVRRRIKVIAEGLVFPFACSAKDEGTDSGDGLTIDASTVNGNIYSAKDITLYNSAVVRGDAATRRDITLLSGSKISGCLNSDNYPPKLKDVSFPDIHSNYKTQAQAGGTHTGNKTIVGKTQTLGPLYITRGLVIRNSNITLTGTVYTEDALNIDNSIVGGKFTLYAAGDTFGNKGLTIEKNSVIGADDQGPLIITKTGEILFEESTFYNVIAYSKEKVVTVDDCVVTGILIGRRGLSVQGGSTITWKNVQGLDFPYTGRAAVPGSWSSN